MATDCYQQLTLWELGQQQVTVDFDGGCLVTDAGLLSLRALDKKLGVLAQVARRLPDPRAQKFVIHTREAWDDTLAILREKIERSMGDIR